MSPVDLRQDPDHSGVAPDGSSAPFGNWNKCVELISFCAPGVMLLTLLLGGCGDQQRKLEALKARSRINMQQVGLAVLNYVSANKQYPPATIDNVEDEHALLSWRVAILPYLDQKQLADQFKLNEEWASPTNKPLSDHTPSVYLSPGDSDPDPGRTNIVAVVGPDTLISSDEAVNSDDCKDGLSQTIVAVELAGFGPRWSEPSEIAVDEFVAAVGKTPSAKGLRPLYASGVLCVFADGSVHSLGKETDPAVLRALCTRSGGETIPPLP
jgi:hypothetical protein